MPHLKIGKHQLEYVWHGPAPSTAPTLVFLHEGLGCVAMWRDFPAQLAEAAGCGALVYSRAGYGQSDAIALPRSLRYMHDEALITLPQILDALQVQQAILVGHSDGGSIALIYAGSGRAERVRGLILEAPHVFTEEITLNSIAAAAENYRNGGLRTALERYHGPNVDCAFWGWNRAWLDPAFRAWNIEEYLPQIRVPVLVIQGADDQYGTLRQVEAIEQGCTGQVCSVVLADCGHSPHRDQPQPTLDAMIAFLREEELVHNG
jgi:pimeloyl-ACP methyl ester carboxylesterase